MRKPPNPNGNPNWKKGVSANPGGRPKTEKEVRELAQEMSVEAVHTLGNVMRNEEADLRVRVAAANAILDRAIGRPAQAVHHSGSIETGSASLPEMLAALEPHQRAMLAQFDPTIAALIGATPTH